MAPVIGKFVYIASARKYQAFARYRQSVLCPVLRVTVKLGNTHMRLKNGVRDIWNAIFTFNDDICLLHCSIKITMPDDLMRSNVMCRIIYITKILAGIRVCSIWLM